MATIKDIVVQLRKTTSRNDKIAILRMHKDNEEWKKFLQYVLNPNITYGVTFSGAVLANTIEPDENFYASLQLLIDRKVTGNEAKELIGKLSKWYSPYVKMILDRTIDAGIQSTLVNKEYPKLIPEFGVHKAKTYAGRADYPLFGEIKYDGFNHTIVVQNHKVDYFTSSGHRFELLDNGIFKDVPDMVYFAELCGTDGRLGDRKNCGIATTLRTRTAKGLPNKSIGSAHWKVFDAVTHEEYKKGIANTPYDQRIDRLISIFHSTNLANRFIITSEKVLEEIIHAVKLQGWEGLVLKQPTMLWNNDGKRRESMMKYKKYISCDLEVVAIEEGAGRLSGFIGSLVVADSTGRIVGKVGTGMSDDDRSLSETHYLGNIIEVKCERISPDGQLIQPVFMGMRMDKTEAEFIPIKG